jgi:hypothetical protein
MTVTLGKSRTLRDLVTAVRARALALTCRWIPALASISENTPETPAI